MPHGLRLLEGKAGKGPMFNVQPPNMVTVTVVNEFGQEPTGKIPSLWQIRSPRSRTDLGSRVGEGAKAAPGRAIDDTSIEYLRRESRHQRLMAGTGYDGKCGTILRMMTWGPEAAPSLPLLTQTKWCIIFLFLVEQIFVRFGESRIPQAVYNPILFTRNQVHDSGSEERDWLLIYIHSHQLL